MASNFLKPNYLTGGYAQIKPVTPQTFKPTSTPYFVPSPTGLPVTQSQVNFLSGSRGSSPTPFYPTPTGAPVPQAPVTISSGGGSSGSVLGAST